MTTDLRFSPAEVSALVDAVRYRLMALTYDQGSISAKVERGVLDQAREKLLTQLKGFYR